MEKEKGVMVEPGEWRIHERRGSPGNSDSVIRGSLVYPTPPKGGEPEERGDEEN